MPSKLNKPDYLLSSDVEKKIMQACVTQGLHHLAMAQSTHNGLTSQEKLEYKHNTLLVSSLLCYNNEESLLKDWEAIDWDFATQAPDLVAYSGNKDAIRLAPIEWKNLKTPQINLKVHEHAWEYESSRPHNNEYFWIVQKMLIEPMGPFGAFYLSDRVGGIGVKNHEVFWDTVLETGKITPNTPMTSSRFPEMGETTLFNLAVLYNRLYVCEKMIPSFHPTSLQANQTLTALLLSREKNNNYTDIIIEKCLNASVDLSLECPFPIDRFSPSVSRLPSWGDTSKSESYEDEEECHIQTLYPLGLVILSSCLVNPPDPTPSWNRLITLCEQYIASLSQEQQLDMFSSWAQQLDFSQLGPTGVDQLPSILKNTCSEVQGMVVGQAFKNCFSAKTWGRETIVNKLTPALRLAENLYPVSLPLEDFKGFVYRLQQNIEKSPKELSRFFEVLTSLKKHISNDRFAEMIDYLDTSPEKALLGLKILEDDLSSQRPRLSQSFKKM